ncbi:MAG: thiamine pyrophosphate-dependent dehydrogenase E1 component subunit alpha, partial [Solirubrobacteraceae bacterium]
LQVHGLVHLSIGSEGVAAGVCRQLRDDDAIYSGHRAHGHALAKGAPMDRVMAELMGRSAGLCQGLGGSMHLVDTPHGLMGATGVVGGNLPMAAGDALATRLRGEDRVTVVFFGDGAVQAGHFSETINLAALWELPLIFVCENNGMAEFTPRSAHTRVARVVDAVAPYDFERRVVEGADAEAVWAAFGVYLRGARAGAGPFLLECSTHRRRGHYEGDQQGYRDELAEAEWARLDPIARLRAQALERRWLDDARADALADAAASEVEQAVAYARPGAPLAPERAAEFVYAR